jgi:hypothetical protein
MAVYTPQGRQGQPSIRHRWQDWLNLILGAALIAIPFLGIGGVHETASVRLALCGTGVAIAAFSLWALAAPAVSAPEWLNMIAALWLFLSPWLMGYDDPGRVSAEAAWAIGAVVLAMAIWASDRPDDMFHAPPAC